MDRGTLALWGVGVLWALFAAWVWLSQKFMENARKLHVALRERQDEQMQGHRVLMAGDASRTEWLRELEERLAGVEALLVSTVGQETEDFCRQMDALFEKMDEAKPEPKKKSEQAEKLTLSEEYVGKFKKKGGAE